MTTLDAGILTTVLLAILGCYVYVHKVERDMGKRQEATEDCVEEELKKVAKAVSKMELAVTNRLTAIETQLGIQLPKKGASGSHPQ